MRLAEQLSLLLDRVAPGRRARALVVPPASLPPRPAARSALADRLYALGLPADCPVRLHANRSTILSYAPHRGLRLHRGFERAPDDVLQAIVRFLKPGVRRAERLECRRRFMTFPVHEHVPPRPMRTRPEPLRPGDDKILDRLATLHATLNASRFAGVLGSIPFRLSSRMHRRLGELRADPVTGRPLEIALSRRHLRRDGWDRFAETLLHEMVHQWQAESGLPLDHGREFRQKALEVGVEPRAVRVD